MTTNHVPVTAVAGPRYYRSFVSYEVPFRPDGSLQFADTEGLRSFYVAYQDLAGGVVRFDKVRLVRLEGPSQEVELSKLEPPGTAVYFQVLRDPSTQGPA